MYVKDADVFYSNFSTAPEYLSGDTAIWNIASMLPNQLGNIFIEEYTDASVIIGTDVNTYTFIFPFINDTTAQNNSDSTYSMVVMSFDPNYKEVQPEIYTTTNIQNLDAIIYTIHFQNTGNYPAFYVTVTDTLSALLDATTFEMIGASHGNYTTQIGIDNMLRVSFTGINLPDSTSDPIGSQGYIIFKIKPNANWNASQTIYNAANIYFDFNAPVITNTVTCSQTTGVIEMPSASSIMVYPNPVYNRKLFFSENIQHASLQLINALGQCVYSNPDFSGTTLKLPASASEGLFVLAIKTKKYFTNIRIVVTEK
jgi:uncharacterized repeat protein (TIGR01451 family)